MHGRFRSGQSLLRSIESPWCIFVFLPEWMWHSHPANVIICSISSTVHSQAQNSLTIWHKNTDLVTSKGGKHHHITVHMASVFNQKINALPFNISRSLLNHLIPRWLMTSFACLACILNISIRNHSTLKISFLSFHLLCCHLCFSVCPDITL